MPYKWENRRGPRRRVPLEMDPVEALLIAAQARRGAIPHDDPRAVAARAVLAKFREEREAQRAETLARRPPNFPFHDTGDSKP
jgi:hypothetical protein